MQKHFQIELPWPHKDLSPNARICYMALARLRKEAKNTAFMFARKAMHASKVGHVRPAGKINVQLVPVPPTRASQDEDNLLAKMKAALDGIALAMKVDDKKFHFLEQVWLPAKKPGRVIVRVSWEEEDE